jgi:putative tricarboxylic transport membrane protein
MESLANLLMGFGIALTPYNVIVASAGVFLGVIIGVLPGLGGTSGVAILLPVTFVMPASSAIIFLTSIYWGALFGGVITSILFNIPGEPWSVAATFDGYPMAKKGQAGYALSVIAAFALIAIGALAGIMPIYTLAALATIPMAFKVFRGMQAHYDSPYELMGPMGTNIGLHLFTGLLLIAGYLVAVV